MHLLRNPNGICNGPVLRPQQDSAKFGLPAALSVEDEKSHREVGIRDLADAPSTLEASLGTFEMGLSYLKRLDELAETNGEEVTLKKSLTRELEIFLASNLSGELQNLHQLTSKGLSTIGNLFCRLKA